MFYVSTKLFQQNPTFYVTYVKMTEFSSTKIGLFATYVFVFFCIGTKNIYFPRNFA
jgi:hypothetical protein